MSIKDEVELEEKAGLKDLKTSNNFCAEEGDKNVVEIKWVKTKISVLSLHTDHFQQHSSAHPQAKKTFLFLFSSA